MALMKNNSGVQQHQGDPFGGGAGGFGGGAGGFGGGAGGFGGGPGGYRGPGNMGGQKLKIERKFRPVFLIASLLTAVVFFLLGQSLYSLIFPYSSILGAGIYFSAFGLVLFGALFLAARIAHMELEGKMLLYALGSFLLLFLLGMLFEFLYELNPGGEIKIQTSYIIAMDNSGSMIDNDPEQKRVDAINEILENKPDDFLFSVYTFGEKTECIREMRPLSEGIGELGYPPSGRTPIQTVLELILDDMKSGKIKYDDGTQVILVTDGIATDLSFTFKSVLKKYAKKRVSISTVGLGSTDNQTLDLDFLNEIASETGGKSVVTDDIGQLSKMMESVVRVIDTDRDLLSYRPGSYLGVLYFFLRVLFVSILGIILTGMKIAILDDSAVRKVTIIISVVCSVIGAILLEVGAQLIPMIFVSRFLMVLLLAVTIVIVEVQTWVFGGIGGTGRLF